MGQIGASSRYTTYNPVVATTNFPVNFPIFDNGDVQFLLNGAPVAFSVTASYVEGVSTDAVCIVDPGVIGAVEIIGHRQPRRTDQYQSGAPLPIENHNYSLNRLTAESQEARRDADRAIKLPLSFEGNPELPVPEPGKALVGTQDGAGLEFAPISPGDISAAIGAAEAIRDETEDIKDAAQDAADASAGSAIASSANAAQTAEDVDTVEEAKNIVLASGGVPFETTAAGIAATVNGQLFEVKGTAGSTVYKTLYKNVAGVATPQDLEILSKAGFDTTFDRTAEWVVYGGPVGYAVVDSAGKVYGAWRQDDGILRSRLALQSSGGVVSYSFNGATGYTDLNIIGLEASDAENIVDGFVAYAPIVDLNYRVFGYGRDDGSYYFHHLVAGRIDGLSGGAVDGAHQYFTAEDIDGLFQIIRYNKSSGIRTQITDDTNNASPHLSADGAYIIYTSSQTIPASEFFQPVAGGAEVPIMSDRTLVAWGNSLSTINYWVSRMPRTTISQGVGGQNDDHVAARMDAIPLTCVVAGNQIPASGSVVVSAFAPNIWFHWNFTTGAFRANIIGSGGEVVAGTLTYSTGTLAFVRDTAGSAVNVLNPATVHITSGKVEGSTNASSAPSLFSLLNSTAILFPNYNSISQALAAGYTLADIFNREVEDFERLQPLLKRFIILGDWMGQGRLTAATAPGFGTAANDAASKQLLDATITLNAMRAAQWPDNFVDMHAELVADGHSSQFTVLGTTYDIIDNTTLVDGIHPTAGGSQTIAYIADAEVEARGF